MPLIEATFTPGATLYAVLHNPDGTVWNNLTQAFEAYNPARWSQYAVALAEQANSGYYSAAYPAAIAGVLTTDLIYAQGGVAPTLSDAPPIGDGQSQGGNIGAIQGDQVAAKNMQANLASQIRGKAVTGTLLPNQATTDLPDTTDNVYVGRLIVWTSGALLRQAANITAYVGAQRLVQFAPLNGVPAPNDTFLII